MTQEEPDKIEAIGKLLSDATSTFVFSEVKYVDQLLSAAARINDMSYQVVSEYLDGSVNSEVRTRAVGKPAPQDIPVRDQARAAAKLIFWITDLQVLRSAGE